MVDRLIELVRESRQVKDYPESSKTDAELGLDKPSAVVSFYVEGQKQVEKKEPEKKEPAKKDDAKKEDKKEPARRTSRQARRL